MTRFSHLDTDEERLPHGMTRVGYDADTQQYTYRDSRGQHYEGVPGAEYGPLTCSGAASRTASPTLQPWEEERRSWRQAWAPLLNFFVLVGLFLIGVIWLLYRSKGSHGGNNNDKNKQVKVDCGTDGLEYEVVKGDTCWGIASGRGLGVEDLVGANEGLDCDALKVGGVICLPSKGEVGEGGQS